MSINKKETKAQGADVSQGTKSVSKSQFITSLKNNALRAEETGLLSEESIKMLKEITKEAIHKHLGEELLNGLD